MDQQTDTHEILRRIRNGDRDAFRILVDRHKRLVSHIVYRTVGRTHDHEDLCQDVFLKVFRRIDTFREEAKLSTWIARIAVNTGVNYLRKKKPSLYEDEPGFMKTADTDALPPDLLAEKTDLNERIEAAVSRLPVQLRTILTLYHVEEMSYKEISEIMNLPEGTMKNYLFRARKKMKTLLADQIETKDILS